MSTPKIISVSFNFKTPDGRPRTYDVSGKTLIVGPNGAGKSAIVQAVSLAISGAAEEVAGRALTADPALLITLAKDHGRDGKPMFARVTLSNGENCQWETQRDGKRIKTPLHIRPRWVVPHDSKQHSPHFPLRDVREVLVGSTKTARARFLTWVCSELEDDVIEKALAGNAQTYKELTKGCDDMAPVDKLTHAISVADKQARALNKAARAQVEVKDRLTSEVGARPEEAAVLAARDTLREATELHETNLLSAGAGEAKKRRQLLNELLGEKRAEEQRLVDALNKDKQRMDKLVGDESLEQKGSLGALNALEWARDEGVDICPLCSSQVGRAHLDACHTFYTEKVEDAQADAKEASHLAQEMATTKARLRSLRQTINDYERELDDLPATSSNVVEVSTDESRDAVAAARAKLDSLTEATTKWKQLDRARELIDDNTREAKRFADFKRAAQKVVVNLLASRTDDFCRRVSAYLPEGWEFGVMVEDEGRDVFYYGLYEGSGEDRYLKVGLSEAQRVVVTIAMCSVLDEMLPTPLVVLTPEDRGWDPDNLLMAMRALSNVKQTVFLTSTVMPRSSACKGWTIIELGHRDTPRLSMDTPAVPAAPAADAVQEAPAMPELPKGLRERQEPSSGRARGGKFRSLKRQVTIFLAEHGLDTTRAVFRLAHPDLVVDDENSPETFAEAAANYLAPIGVQ